MTPKEFGARARGLATRLRDYRPGDDRVLDEAVASEMRVLARVIAGDHPLDGLCVDALGTASRGHCWERVAVVSRHRGHGRCCVCGDPRCDHAEARMA